MDDKTQYYQKKAKELQSLIQQIELNQANYIPGTLRLSSSGGHARYYLHTQGNDGKPKSRYLKTEEIAIAKQLAQQEYEGQLLRLAKKQLRNATAHLTEFDERPLWELHPNLHKARKCLVTPLIEDDATFVAKWLSQLYTPGTFADDAPDYYAGSGVRVRSKSEKIIADLYSKLEIPFLYERPIKLREGGRFITIRPDFTLLNVRTREQFIHEHFGMIDNPQYAENFIRKLELYEKNGIFPGRQLLITWESSLRPLNTSLVELLAKEYLL